jgi:hypothetical protein
MMIVSSMASISVNNVPKSNTLLKLLNVPTTSPPSGKSHIKNGDWRMSILLIFTVQRKTNTAVFSDTAITRLFVKKNTSNPNNRIGNKFNAKITIPERRNDSMTS